MHVQWYYPIKFSNGKAQLQIRRIHARGHTRYIRKSGQQNRELIGVLYKFRLTTLNERSVVIDREEIASVVAGRNDVANVKEAHFRRVSACDARKKWNAIAVGCAQ